MKAHCFWKVFWVLQDPPPMFFASAPGRLLLQELARWETLAEEPRDAWCHGFFESVGQIWQFP